MPISPAPTKCRSWDVPYWKVGRWPRSLPSLSALLEHLHGDSVPRRRAATVITPCPRNCGIGVPGIAGIGDANHLCGTYRTAEFILPRDSTGKGNAVSLIAALALAAQGTPGTTGRWWLMMDDGQQTWFADGLTIARPTDEIADLTYQTVNRAPRGAAAASVTRIFVNCPDRRTKIASIADYDREGLPVPGAARDLKGEWQSVIPDTTGETLWLAACRGVKEWPALGYMAVFRPPDRVTRDMVIYEKMGISPDDAAAIARYSRWTQLPQIAAEIDARTAGEVRNALRQAFDLRVEVARPGT